MVQFRYFGNQQPQTTMPTPTTQPPVTTTQPEVSTPTVPQPTNYAQYNPYEDKAQKFTGLLDQLGQFSEQDEYLWGYYQQIKDKDKDSTLHPEWKLQWADLNGKWTSYKTQMQGIESTLRELGMDVIYDDQGYTTRVVLPDGRRVTLNDALGYASGEVDRLNSEALGYGSSQDTFDQLEEFFTTYGGTDVVDPFGDPNGWDQMIQEVFGELGATPDTAELMKSFYNLFPMQDYSADALPDLSMQERSTKFFDDLRAQGFALDPEAGGLDQQLRDQLYNQVMDMSGRIFSQLNLNRAQFDQMSGYELSELTKVIGRSSVLEDKEMRDYVKNKMKSIRLREKATFKDRMGQLAVANANYGGAAIRTVAELSERMAAEEMGLEADIFMRSIELAEQGKMTALTQLGRLTDTQAQFAIQLGGLQNTYAGQIMDFAVGIANVSASEYKTKVDQKMAIADLELKANLGIAGLEIEKYRTDKGIDLEQLKLDYSNYWQEQGFEFEAKEAEFNQAVTSWQTAAMMTELVESGRTDRLVSMMDLAIKAQGGDMEAWQMYNQMLLTQNLENRGYDIQQAGMLSDLAWSKYQMQETFNFQRWAIENQALLERELAKLNADTQLAIAQMEQEAAQGGFWSDLANLAGGVGGLITGIGALNLAGGKSGGGNAAV